MIQLRQLSWLSNTSNFSLLALKVWLWTTNLAPFRQPGQPAQFLSGETTAGTQ